MARLVLAFAGLTGALSVAADAAARHMLAADAARADWATTGAHYGLIHALALLALAALLSASRPGAARFWLGAASFCFIVGSVLFCGGLWLLAWGTTSAVAHAIPAGGVLFILGWLALLAAALAPRRLT